MNKGHFINEQDILEQWGVWKNSAEKLEDRVIPDKLIEQMYVIATHLLEHKRFVRYPYHEKEDMKQEGVLKCMKNLKNYDPTKGKIFSYFTRCCWTAYVVYLAQYYKDLNDKMGLLLEAVQQIDEGGTLNTPYLKKLMGDISSTLSQYKGEGD